MGSAATPLAVSCVVPRGRTTDDRGSGETRDVISSFFPLFFALAHDASSLIDIGMVFKSGDGAVCTVTSPVTFARGEATKRNKKTPGMGGHGVE